jgi:hypothetical protein
MPITLANGQLKIIAPNQNGNTVSVTPGANSTVRVYINGSVQEFPASEVATILYVGGSGGNDTFTDSLDLPVLEYGYGSGNSFESGLGTAGHEAFAYAFFQGGSNTYTAQSGSFSDVFQGGGSVAIVNPTGAPVQLYP